MEKLYKWLTIGSLSFFGLLVCVVVSWYDRKLTVSLAIVCFLMLLLAAIIIIRNRRLFKSPPVCNPKTIIGCGKATAFFMAVMLMLSLFFELCLSFAYWAVTPPPSYFYEYEGVEPYQNNEYENFRFGKEAKLFLPTYDEFEDAKDIEFTYYDGFLTETLFFPGMVEFYIKVSYDPKQYSIEKAAVCQKGEDFGGQIFDVRLLEKKKLSYGNCLYYIVICSDNENAITYCVSVQDNNNYSTYFDFPYPGS